MCCGHCVARVQQTLDALPGVRVENVRIGTATVAYNAQVESAAAIATAVSDAGQPALVASDASAPVR